MAVLPDLAWLWWGDDVHPGIGAPLRRLMQDAPMITEHPTDEAYCAAIGAAQPGAYIATDADGTLWGCDVGDDLVRCLAQLDPRVDLEAYLKRMDFDYHGGCREAADLLRAREMSTVAPALTEFLTPRLNPRTALVDALRAAEARGVKVWVVSASPRDAAAVGLAMLGVDWPIIGIEPDGPRSGVFRAPVPVGEGKVEAWYARGLPQPALAFGDSKWDRPLLESAAQGFYLSKVG